MKKGEVANSIKILIAFGLAIAVGFVIFGPAREAIWDALSSIIEVLG
ncbi:hypothetical protein ACFL1B_06065 [Nanoarchaeota archaeon]